MHFPTTLSLLGLAACVAAAPMPGSEIELAERGVIYMPKQLQRRFRDNDVVAIAESSEVQLTVDSRQREVFISERISEELVISQRSNDGKDRIRRNNFRNRNRDNNVNIVIIQKIVVIIDNIVSERFLTRQVRVDNGRDSRDDIFIAVTEVEIVTIDNNSRGRNGFGDGNNCGVGNSFATGTAGINDFAAATTTTDSAGSVGTVAVGTQVLNQDPPVMTVDPNQAVQANNVTMLYPADLGAPNFQGVPVQEDPANIAVQDVDAYVQYS